MSPRPGNADAQGASLPLAVAFVVHASRNIVVQALDGHGHTGRGVTPWPYVAGWLGVLAA